MNPQRYYKRVSPTVPNSQSASMASDMPSPGFVYRAGLAKTRGYEELAGIGNMLTQIGVDAYKQVKQAEYHDQIGQAKLAYLQNDLAFRDELAQAGDTSTWESRRAENMLKFRNSLKLSNKQAADDFGLWLDAKEAEQKHYVNTRKLRVDADNFVTNFNASLKLRGEVASQTADDIEYQKQVIEMAQEYGLQFNEKSGNFTPIKDWNNEMLVGEPQTRMKLFQLWLSDTNSKREKYIQKLTLGAAKQQIEGEARQLATEGGWGQSIKYVIDPKNQQSWANEFGLNLDEVQKITSDLNTMFSAEDRIAKEQLEIQREQDRDKISKAIAATDPNTGDFIDNSSLDETEQNTWRDRWEKKASGKEFVHDPDVYWPLLRRVTNDPEKVDEAEIASLVGKGLTTDDYKELMRLKKTEPDDPLKSQQAQFYMGLLEQIAPKAEEIEELSVLSTEEYDEKMRKLIEFAQTNPEATPAEWTDFFDKSIATEKRNYLWDILFKRAPWRTYREWKESKKEPEKKAYKYTAVKPKTGERMGSNDGVKWEKIQ